MNNAFALNGISMLRFSALSVVCVLCVISWSSAHAVEFNSIPGRAQPHQTVEAQAFYIAWGDGESERSFVVIEPGDALRRPVVIATVQLKTGKLRVAYAGTAFRDEQGHIHIDCRSSRLYGPESQNWSPDSFVIDKTGAVRCIDDANRGSAGRVISWAVRNGNEKILKNAPMRDRLYKNMSYEALRLKVRVYLEGVL